MSQVPECIMYCNVHRSSSTLLGIRSVSCDSNPSCEDILSPIRTKLLHDDEVAYCACSRCACMVVDHRHRVRQEDIVSELSRSLSKDDRYCSSTRCLQDYRGRLVREFY